MNSETIVLAVFWTGMGILILGAVLSNLAMVELNREVNRAYDIRHRIDPQSMSFPARPSMKQVLERIRLYKAAYGNGPQWRRLKAAYWVAGFGMAISAASIWLKKSIV